MTFTGKAYITHKDENNSTYVVIENKKIVMDPIVKGKFINNLSTYVHLGTYRIRLDDIGNFFNLLNMREDKLGHFINFETNHWELIDKINSCTPLNFNVKSIGNITVSYGSFFDKAIANKFYGGIIKHLFIGRLKKTRIMKLSMTYNSSTAILQK
jgi:hypothetical protein